MEKWKHSFSFLLLASCSTLTLAQYYGEYSEDLRGPYCQQRGCCNGRQDECGTPILGTLCYCDDFCNRTRNDDCCPDYWTHCKNLPAPIPSPILGCTHNGRVYPLGHVIKQNCNDCKCERTGDKTELLCTTDPCLIEPDLIAAINRPASAPFRAANHSAFWGRTLAAGLTLRLGTLRPHRLRVYPLRPDYAPAALPRSFLAADAWPRLLGAIADQGWCGASWALSTAAVAADRLAIHSKGVEAVRLSAQHLLSCDVRGQAGCAGGSLDRAWNFVRKWGLVDEACYPYVGRVERCRVRRGDDLAAAGCALPRNVERVGRYQVAPVYRVENETDIMFEIKKSGPVQATMKVYPDFFVYKNGIYKHIPNLSSERTGYHSVRIVGWGEEYTSNGLLKYWTVANSWGTDWGEDGYFRIVRGTNECEIESLVLGAWPYVENKLLIGNDIPMSPPDGRSG